MIPPPTAPSVFGPVDRESFFAAQARHRRASRIWAAAAGGAVALLGLPLSAVLSPLLVGFAVLGADLANLISPTFDLWPKFVAALQAVNEPRDLISTSGGLRYTAFSLVPGMVVLLVSWLGVKAAYRRSGVGGMLLALGARAPRPGDLEERQLENVCQEMALAAGVPAPRVMILDRPGIHAAAVGSRPEDATIVVSRGLLERCDREETQGLIGHLIASVGNGDLRIVAAILSLFQALGLVTRALAAPFGPASRQAIGRFLRLALLGGRGVADADAVTELLTAEENEDLERLSKRGKTRIKDIFRLPFLLAWMAFWLNQKIFEMLLIGPVLAFGFRRRRLLADAGAVQLTRHPDGLARGLALAVQGDTSLYGGKVLGGRWAALLFEALPEAPSAGARGLPGITSFEPSFAKRLARLIAMGADPALAAGLPARGAMTALQMAILALVAPLLLLCIGLALLAAFLIVMVSLAVDLLFFLGFFVLPLHVLLRGPLLHWLTGR